jgi:ATP-binding cassette subfamily B (MDR/TAP) protein 1
LQANVAAKKVFELLDSPGEEDWTSGDYSAVPSELKGDVAFKNMEFEYPTRPGGMRIPAE